MSIELYDWQKEAINLIRKENSANILITAPTSAGKTLVNYAFLNIFDPETGKFQNPENKVIYTVPIKSLANDKFYELSKLGLNVGLQTGDIVINPEANIVVCTQEVYQEVYKGKGYNVVIDEFHYAFQNAERALSFVNLSPRDRYLFSSATIKVDEQLLNYLSRITGRRIMHYHTEFRPTELVFQKKPITPFPLSSRLGVSLEEVYNENNLVLSVAFTRRNLFEIAYLLGNFLDDLPTNKKEEILQLAREFKITGSELKEEFPFWERGIFIYHGKLPYTLKRFIEEIARRNLIRTVISTDAISLGVNFPISDVVFYQLTKFDGQVWRTLYPSEFKQIAGRAGRKGFFDIGRVWSVNKDLNVDRHNDTFELFEELVDKPLEEPEIQISLSLLDLINIYEEKEIKSLINRLDRIGKEVDEEDLFFISSIDELIDELGLSREEEEIVNKLQNAILERIYEYFKYAYPVYPAKVEDIKSFFSDEEVLSLVITLPIIELRKNSPEELEMIKKLLRVKEINPIVISSKSYFEPISLELYRKLVRDLTGKKLTYGKLVDFIEILTRQDKVENPSYINLVALKILRKTNSLKDYPQIYEQILEELKEHDYLTYKLLRKEKGLDRKTAPKKDFSREQKFKIKL